MGTLYIVSTPIGNLEDITIRAIKTLLTVPVIACEDTRRTGQLLKLLRERYASMIRIIEAKEQALISYYDEVEEKKTPDVVQLLDEGKDVALVSDAGTPLISDPGYKLIHACIRKCIPITSIPGPSAVTNALTISGLPTDQFLFLGYLPEKASKRQHVLEQLLSYPSRAVEDRSIHPTVILFESPHRLKETLVDIRCIFGDTDIAIARELTKVHEEVWRGTCSAAPSYLKGELVLLFRLP